MELNYAGLALKHNLEKHPELFSLENLDEKIAQTIAASQATSSINAAARAEKDVEGLELQHEYNELRLKFHGLQEELRGCENHVNEAAGKIRNLEKQVTTLKVMLSAATEVNNPHQEKAVKHLLTQCEADLADAKDAHHLACRYNKKAVQQLREFDKSRISELRKQIEEIHKGNKVLIKPYADKIAADMQADHEKRQKAASESYELG